MGMLDGVLGQVLQNVDVATLAIKVGLTPQQVEAALQALGQAHAAPGDTVGTAAANTGLSPETLQRLLQMIGGEETLAKVAAMLGAQGGVLGQLGTLASGFFAKR
jgi:hypothetical protein